MFVILVKYTKPIADIDRLLSAHVRFLDEQYAAGIIVASGPRVPREGGVILAHGRSRGEIEEILRQDPFSVEGAAAYEVIEFAPRKAGYGFEGLLCHDKTA
ncbi:MAG: YciI family protein [Candidatus Omnitrophota bacterium]